MQKLVNTIWPRIRRIKRALTDKKLYTVYCTVTSQHQHSKQLTRRDSVTRFFSILIPIFSYCQNFESKRLLFSIFQVVYKSFIFKETENHLRFLTPDFYLYSIIIILLFSSYEWSWGARELDSLWYVFFWEKRDLLFSNLSNFIKKFKLN